MSTLAAAASSSSTSSPGCAPFAFRRGGGARGRLPAPGTTARTVAHGGTPAAAAAAGGRPLCRPAEVLGEGIQNAFFASLDVCSCVKLRTDSFREESESSEAVPLMMMPPPPRDDRGGSAGRRRASAGGKPRRGIACCTPKPNSTSVN